MQKQDIRKFCDLSAIIAAAATGSQMHRGQRASQRASAAQKLMNELSQLEDKELSQRSDSKDDVETLSDSSCSSTVVNDWSDRDCCGASNCSIDTFTKNDTPTECWKLRRRLPCCSFIATGACLLWDRCTYLHDTRCMTAHEQVCFPLRGPRSFQFKHQGTYDKLLYWPSLKVGIHDRYPSFDSPYHVEYYNSRRTDKYSNELAVHSLWMHFLWFCISLGCCTEADDYLYHEGCDTILFDWMSYNYENVNCSANVFTKRNRLPIFQAMALGAR